MCPTDRFGQRPGIVLAALVIFVWQDLQGRRRYRRHKCFFDARSAECSFEIFDVAPNRRVTGIFDRTGASEAIHARAARARRLGALTGSGALRRARFLRIEFGEIPRFFAAERPGRPSLLCALFPQLEARQAIVDVGPPGAEIDLSAHRFRKLAVVDDVDAAIGLLANDVRYRGFQSWQQRNVGSVVSIERDQIARPRQTAHMGRENPTNTALHVRFLLESTVG